VSRKHLSPKGDVEFFHPVIPQLSMMAHFSRGLFRI
jgi:hypothetical protein